MDNKQIEELILQSLEHEMGGERVYVTALDCAINTDLKHEWEKYLDQTRMHVSTLRDICDAFSIDPEQETSGRAVIRRVGAALEEAMRMALTDGDARAAEIVAAECVVLAETKDHLDWELLSKCAQEMDGTPEANLLRSAAEKMEDQEDEHLYHSRGFCRELWLKSLGMKAFLPPPEEKQKVKSAASAQRAAEEADKRR
jgi:hypothetical protein